ncbi:MAG: hypothetical protein DSM106950_11580 [Stigonema ocellatum SAG 48.90 = DSM 106950]|nr:hypothetical protein [Stigonema ocellatum SAG 48.90 = DSM 106950]
MNITSLSLLRTSRTRSLMACLAMMLVGACGGGGSSGTPPAPIDPPKDSLLSQLLNFAETADFKWNFGGHVVTDQFTEAQGRWAYTDTTYDPWLYDRAEAWRMLAEMTHDVRWDAKAAVDLYYYESRLSADGIFLNKQGEPDTKYSYVHVTGSTAAKQLAAYNATVAGFPSTPVLTSGHLWNERELWVALDAAVKYQAATKDPASLERGQAMVNQWDTVCAGRKAPLVSYTLHEGGRPDGSQPTDLVSSPWMSALYFQSARLYALQKPSAANQIHRQASDYFDWLNTPTNRGFYPGSDISNEWKEFTFPANLAGGTLIGDATPTEADMDHALDMAGFIAFAIKAKQALGLPTADAKTRLAQMERLAARAFEASTGTIQYLPKYRLTPPRKFNWWTRGLYELSVNRDAP